MSSSHELPPCVWFGSLLPGISRFTVERLRNVTRYHGPETQGWITRGIYWITRIYWIMIIYRVLIGRSSKIPRFPVILRILFMSWRNASFADIWLSDVVMCIFFGIFVLAICWIVLFIVLEMLLRFFAFGILVAKMKST